MSPYLARPVRSYAEAAHAIVKASAIPGMRISDERLRLLEIIERELHRRYSPAITNARTNRA